MILSSIMNEHILGWDCEWLMRPGIFTPDTIQISGAKHVWIIDGVWLCSEAVQKEVKADFEAFIVNPKVFHIFKAKDDLDRLARYTLIPCLQSIPHVIDIDALAHAIGFKRETSLSYYLLLTEGYRRSGVITYRKALDKTARMSDWTQRPLGMKQIFYAAQDAYVTRQVYIGMARILLMKPNINQLKDNLELIKKDVILRAVQRGKKSTNKTNNQRWNAFFEYKPVLPAELKTIVHESIELCEDSLYVCNKQNDRFLTIRQSNAIGDQSDTFRRAKPRYFLSHC